MRGIRRLTGWSLLPWRTSLRLQTGAFVALICILLIGLDGWRLLASRATQMAAIETANANLTRSVAQQAQSTVELTESVLNGIAHRIESEGLAPVALARLHEFMTLRIAELPRLRGLFVYDAEGNWAVTSLPVNPVGANSADREHFRHHRSTHDLLPYLGAAIRSRATGEWVFTVSRRLETPDGRFSGVVLTTVPIRNFIDFYATLDVGAHGAVALLRDDGSMLARYPFQPAYMDISLADSPLFREQLPAAP